MKTKNITTVKESTSVFSEGDCFKKMKIKTKNQKQKITKQPLQSGAVDIASASGTRRSRFKSHQGIRFLGKHRSAVEYETTYYA
jgi:hypothetical protein